jgi:hypothetical protein
LALAVLIIRQIALVWLVRFLLLESLLQQAVVEAAGKLVVMVALAVVQVVQVYLEHRAQ